LPKKVVGATVIPRYDGIALLYVPLVAVLWPIFFKLPLSTNSLRKIHKSKLTVLHYFVLLQIDHLRALRDIRNQCYYSTLSREYVCTHFRKSKKARKEFSNDVALFYQNMLWYKRMNWRIIMIVSMFATFVQESFGIFDASTIKCWELSTAQAGASGSEGYYKLFLMYRLNQTESAIFMSFCCDLCFRWIIYFVSRFFRWSFQICGLVIAISNKGTLQSLRALWTVWRVGKSLKILHIQFKLCFLRSMARCIILMKYNVLHVVN
jgi:hypothetical protein